MSLLLPSIISNRQQPFVLVQSSVAQSALPVFRGLLEQDTGNVVLLCVLHTPSILLSDEALSSSRVHVLDWSGLVPGYDDPDYTACQIQVKAAVDKVSPGPLTIAIDSVDTLHDDLKSISATFKFLTAFREILEHHTAPSRLICHINTPSPLCVLLTQVAFSPVLAHITAHPPALLTHIATAYLIHPPPESSPERFWRVFTPLAARSHEVEALVFGLGGEGGGGGSTAEIVIEVLLRGTNGHGHARRRGVERGLEGWNCAKHAPSELSALVSLKHLWGRKVAAEQNAPDPTKNLPFNLSLTPSQQESRSHVPLPYAHEGPRHPLNPGQIFYDPDSADDLDDEDPDEDLDI